MADERARLTGEEQPIPAGYRWADLAAPQMEGVRARAAVPRDAPRARAAGRDARADLRKAQNKIQDPAKLRQLIVELIGQENWSAMSADVKGDAYEGLLERNAQDVKGGAGQYFTPRAADRRDRRLRPARSRARSIGDPACGTGGFLLAAHDYIARHHELDRDQKRHLRFEALRGVELVDSVTRLCAHEPVPARHRPDATTTPSRRSRTDDALRDEPTAHVDVVLTNPPFGKKSSITVVNEEGDDRPAERSPTIAPTSGPRPRTSSSTSSST